MGVKTIFYPSERITSKYILWYWILYVLLFSAIQGIPANDFFTAFYCEIVSVIPKIIFVLIITETLTVRYLFTKRITAFMLFYIVTLFLFAMGLRVIDNYIIIKYFLTNWHKEPLFSVAPLLYNAVKLQFLLTIPFSIKLYNRFLEKKIQYSNLVKQNFNPEKPFINIKHEREIVKIDLEEILYVEAQRNYVVFYLENRQLKTYESISAMAKKLPEGKFARVHRSFIISLAKTEAYTSSYAVIRKKQIPIGRQYNTATGNILQKIESQNTSFDQKVDLYTEL